MNITLATAVEILHKSFPSYNILSPYSKISDRYDR